MNNPFNNDDLNTAIAMSMNWVLNAYNFYKEQVGDDGIAMELTDIWWANLSYATFAGGKKED